MNPAPQALPAEIAITAAILSCVVLLVAVIYKLGFLDQIGAADVAPNSFIPARVMGQVYNPFSLDLLQPHKASLGDGLSVRFSAHCPCVIHLLWGATIQEIFPTIFQPWPQFKEALIGNKMQESSISQQKITFDTPIESRTLHWRPPMNIHLGDPPRPRYPMVLLVTDLSALSNQRAEEEYAQVVSMVMLLHLSDPVCPAESHIMAHYVRTPTGRPVNLKPLYVSSDDSPAPDDVSGMDDSGDVTSTGTCVVCAEQPVQRALLPCRHACLCDWCSVRCITCPMCRSVIQSYFSIGQDVS